MDTFKRIALSCFVLTVVVPGIATAQARPWHFGVAAGQADVGVDGLDEPIQIQASFGYDVWRPAWGVVTAEAIASTTVSEGDISSAGGEWDVTTLGVSATYRMSDVTFYPLARLGYQYADVTVDVPVFGSESEDDSGLIAGIGAGFLLTEAMALELSWTRQFDLFDEDLDIIALGVRF